MELKITFSFGLKLSYLIEYKWSKLIHLSPNNLQTQLNTIQLWSQTWQLSISYTKCNYTILGHNTNHINFTLDNHPLAQVAVVKDLGISIDSQLKFQTHINEIVSKANQRSAFILLCFLSRNPINLVRAFKVYIRP